MEDKELFLYIQQKEDDKWAEDLINSLNLD